jgi:GNAT superfamily N-acetyltransferase
MKDLAFVPRVRLAQPSELAGLVSIDDDASELYAQYGVTLQLSADDAFSLAERARWFASAERGWVFVAIDGFDTPLGFAALDMVDGQPYLEQLAVRRRAMRRGLGELLLERGVGWAEQQTGDALWLTTYAHLPFNRAYYERRGFVVVPEAACGPGVRHHLEEQRRFLPSPNERIAMRRALRTVGPPQK